MKSLKRLRNINFKKIFWWSFFAIVVFSIIVGPILFFTCGISLPNGETLNYDYLSSISNERGIILDGVLDTIGELIVSIIIAVFTLVLLIVESLTSTVINAIQDIILILFDGSIIYENLGITYEVYLAIAIIIFTVMLIIYLGIRFWGVSRGKHNSKNVILSIIGALALLVMAPLAFQILFLSVQYVFDYIFDLNFSDVSIYDIIAESTIDNIQIVESVFNFDDAIINSAYIIGYLIAIYFCFVYLLKFAFALALRIFELFIFGLLALPFVAAASVEDGGERVKLWSSIMIQKILNPFFLLLGYLIALFVLPIIIEVIETTDWNYTYSDSIDMVRLFLDVAVISATFLLLESLSSEWAFVISKDTKGAFATQLNHVAGVQGKAIIPVTKMMTTTTILAGVSLKNSPVGTVKSINEVLLKSLNKNILNKKDDTSEWLNNHENGAKKRQEQAKNKNNNSYNNHSNTGDS